MSGLVLWVSGLLFGCLDFYLGVWTSILPPLSNYLSSTFWKPTSGSAAASQSQRYSVEMCLKHSWWKVGWGQVTLPTPGWIRGWAQATLPRYARVGKRGHVYACSKHFRVCFYICSYNFAYFDMFSYIFPFYQRWGCLKLPNFIWF